jgi:hypothetical protein
LTPDDVSLLRSVYEEWSVGNFLAGRELLAPERMAPFFHPVRAVIEALAS